MIFNEITIEISPLSLPPSLRLLEIAEGGAARQVDLIIPGAN
jgi:hypothetical protein